MRPWFRMVLVAGLASLLVGGGRGVDAQQGQAAQPILTPTPAQPPNPEFLAGSWDYNAVDSVDAATGRPEQSPQSATRRGAAVPRQPPVIAPPGSGGVGGTGGGTRSGNGGLGMNPLMMREVRGMMRDLVEIAETLTITLAPDAITIVDDLKRERTYPTNNRKQKYRIGAAEFHAAVRWDNGQLRKEIEGDYGFKMTETYFASVDGKRLFLVVRLGDPRRKDLPIIGANRVYDRVNQ